MEKSSVEDSKFLPLKKQLCVEQPEKQKIAAPEEESVPLSGRLNQDKSTISEYLLPLKKRLLHEEDNEPSDINVNNENNNGSDNNNNGRDNNNSNNGGNNSISNNDDANNKKKSSLRDDVKSEQNSKQQEKKRKRQVRRPFEYKSAAATNQRRNYPADDDFYDDVWKVIDKKLTSSDVSLRQARLAIPGCQIVSNFLTKEEEEFLKGEDEDGNRCKIEVKVRGCNSVKDHTMYLSRWNYPQNKLKKRRRRPSTKKVGWKFALHGRSPSWETLMNESRLVEGDSIGVAAFRSRKDGSLCFAIEGGRMLSSGVSKNSREGMLSPILPTWGKKRLRT